MEIFLENGDFSENGDFYVEEMVDAFIILSLYYYSRIVGPLIVTSCDFCQIFEKNMAKKIAKA